MSQSLLIDDDCNPITNPYYYAQNIMADSYINQEETAENKVKPGSSKPMKKVNKNKKRIASKRKLESSLKLSSDPPASSSYIIKKETRRAMQLIKINILDLYGSELNNSSDIDSASVSVQYIVTDSYDDIADATKRLINKIVNKINETVLL